ncbi:MAG TPA: alginate lyase family protein [Polyangia bacterium]
MPADPSTGMFRATLLALSFAQACASKQAALPAPAQAALQPEARASQERTPTPLGPPIFLHRAEVLARHKARYTADPQHPEPALLRLLDDARKALAQKPFSVTEKTVLPPSGDKHDYLSLAPYFWPNPSKPNGLPYVQRDGQSNPERDGIADHVFFSRIVVMTETLGLAYYFTGDESFAEHAASLLRAFFIEPTTRMNPNLNFAQGVRGKESGRAAGIMDTAGMARLVDGVGLLSGCKSLLTTDRDGLLAWFRDYLTWLRESELGRREGQARNNHGTWYDVQSVSLALATGQIELAREILQFSHKRRIGRQIEPDGRQPEELQRTKSWHYSIYNLQALVALANLGDRAGVELWHYQTPDGRSIRKAIDWLIPFALGDKPWTTPEIGGFKPEALWPIVREAAFRLQDARFAEVAARLGQQPADRLWLLVE